MKYKPRQHEILLLRLAEHFGEVVPFDDLAVALGLSRGSRRGR